jgi:heat shock protein HslJ
MRSWTLLSLVFVIAAVTLSGCTGQHPAATPATPVAPITVPPTAISPSVPPELAGNWALTTLAVQDGTAITRPVSEITLTFMPDSTLTGYDGCNNYYATMNLTGTPTLHGTDMMLGPVGRSTKSCPDLANQEQQYLAILGQTTAYDVDGTQLTLTATTGDVLIYQRPSTLVTPKEGSLPG